MIKYVDVRDGNGVMIITLYTLMMSMMIDMTMMMLVLACDSVRCDVLMIPMLLPFQWSDIYVLPV